jgi:hypothetical protein
MKFEKYASIVARKYGDRDTDIQKATMLIKNDEYFSLLYYHAASDEFYIAENHKWLKVPKTDLIRTLVKRASMCNWFISTGDVNGICRAFKMICPEISNAFIDKQKLTVNKCFDYLVEDNNSIIELGACHNHDDIDDVSALVKFGKLGLYQMYLTIHQLEDKPIDYRTLLSFNSFKEIVTPLLKDKFSGILIENDKVSNIRIDVDKTPLSFDVITKENIDSIATCCLRLTGLYGWSSNKTHGAMYRFEEAEKKAEKEKNEAEERSIWET